VLVNVKVTRKVDLEKVRPVASAIASAKKAGKNAECGAL